MHFTLKLGVTVLVAMSVSASAADLAVLSNGNSIRYERRETVGPVTRLYLSSLSNGYIDIPSEQIDHFEADDNPAPVVAGTPNFSGLTATQAPSGAAANQQLNQSHAKLDRQNLDAMVNGAGQRNQIDPDFINSVIRAESGFHSHAVSKKGAQGLMQLMPQTASALGVRNSFDPSSNVEGGTKYLRELLEKYNYDVPKALAAYNAGSSRVDKYRGVPPYFETQTYVARIIRDYNRKKLAENPELAKTKPRVKSKTTASKQSNPRSKSKAANPFPKTAETASR